MRYRLLGRTGLRVSELFLGAMTFGDDFSWGADKQTSKQLLDTYLDAGGNVVDTAVNYRGGDSERILGEVIGAGRRDRLVLSTKYTVSRDPDDPNASGNHRKNLRLSLETSLRRLKTDHIDLYYVHIWDRHTPIDETMRALDDAVTAGKISYVGVSDTPAWVVAQANTLADWRGWAPFCALQVRYNLIERDAERELIPAAEALGLAVAAWGPLAGGTLSGKFSGAAVAESGTRVNSAELSVREQLIASTVVEVAAELDATPAQVAIAWTMHRSGAVHPILGARRTEQLEDNLAALDVVLPVEAVDRLEAATAFDVGFPTNFIQGTQDFVYGPAGALVDGRGAVTRSTAASVARAAT